VSAFAAQGVTEPSGVSLYVWFHPALEFQLIYHSSIVRGIDTFLWKESRMIQDSAWQGIRHQYVVTDQGVSTLGEGRK